MQNTGCVSVFPVINMVERKTMRPVTLRRVIEICSLAAITKELDIKTVAQKLEVSPSRAREILLEVEKMGLLRQVENAYLTSDKTTVFLKYFEDDQWDKIHKYFLANYKFYQDFIRILQDRISDKIGLSIDEIKEESALRKMSINQTAVEVLSDWCERLGVIQRHLYSRRLYLIKNRGANQQAFKANLIKVYQELSSSKMHKRIFVEIPAIRENLCEELKISRNVFDEMLRQIYLENVGKIELSGAPITTLAKKSPLSEKKMRIQGKEAILSPEFGIAKEREGLSVGQKAYYYLAIHEDV